MCFFIQLNHIPYSEADTEAGELTLQFDSTTATTATTTTTVTTEKTSPNASTNGQTKTTQVILKLQQQQQQMLQSHERTHIINSNQTHLKPQVTFA